MPLWVPGLDFTGLVVLYFCRLSHRPSRGTIAEKLRRKGPKPKKYLHYRGIYIKIHQYFVSLAHPKGR